MQYTFHPDKLVLWGNTVRFYGGFMYKKSKWIYFSILSLFMIQSSLIMPSFLFNQNNADMEQMGAALIRGMGTEIGKQLRHSSPETTQEFLNSIVKGLSGSLKGEELKKLLTHIQETFDNKGDAQKAANAAIDFNTRNINRFFNNGILNNLSKIQIILLTSAILYFTAQYGIPMTFRMIERQWLRPKLIISSSKKGFFTSWFKSQPEKTPMIFSPDLEKRLENIVQVTQTIHKKIKEGSTNVKYRNLMLYGPPGTGKTLFATELAKRSGLEYVSMSGSSFSKFKDGEGIEELDQLFAWANKGDGFLIFIDEAEAFLSMRENMDPQSRGYQILNNFLNYTGTRSNKFMLVFATNHKDSLDSAMHRRIDDLIELPLPEKTERIKILNLYIDIILMDLKQNEATLVQSVKNILTASKIEQIAEATNGLSAGDLEGIINTLKTDADTLTPCAITHDLVQKVVNQAVEKHQAFITKKLKI